jgi:hypothetical protein
MATGWVEENLDFSHDQATQYMKLALLWDEVKLRDARNLTQALRLLTEPTGAAEGPTQSDDDGQPAPLAPGAVWVNRQQFLLSLELTQPGLSRRQVLDQSDFFIFKAGKVYTYCDEVFCRCRSGLPKTIVGAVRGKPLLAVLGHLPDERIQVAVDDPWLIIAGKNRKANVVMETEILLPLHEVERPGDWSPLHPDFCEAVGTVVTCAGKDESRFETVLVHIHPDWLEASDRFRWCRWPLKTGLASSTQVRADALKHIAPLGVTEFNLTDNWLHFRSPATGLVCSCRCYQEEYPNLSKYVRVDGVPLTLPRGLKHAIQGAALFAKQNDGYEERVLVHLRPHRLTILGSGPLGSYEETKKLDDYRGPSIRFLLSPKILEDVVVRNHPVDINGSVLHIKTDQYVFAAWLFEAQHDPEKTPAG